MVVIRVPATAPTGIEQERCATPSTWTVQAPHWAMPQPYLVPVIPSVSRSTHRSGVSGSTSTLWLGPFVMSVGIHVPPGCVLRGEITCARMSVVVVRIYGSARGADCSTARGEAEHRVV